MSGPPRYRLLIVEDNEDTQELLLAQLDHPDYEIATATNGQEAILTVGQDAPSLVIMDIMMPTLDGLETSRYFKLRFRSGPAPILVLSAKGDFASREQAGQYGCEEYIAKPHDRKALVESVQALLEIADLERAQLEGRAEPAMVQRNIALRLALAERQLREKSLTIARQHLNRILALDPEHARARALLGDAERGAQGG